jgi:hypothetical protein
LVTKYASCSACYGPVLCVEWPRTSGNIDQLGVFACISLVPANICDVDSSQIWCELPHTARPKCQHHVHLQMFVATLPTKCIAKEAYPCVVFH